MFDAIIYFPGVDPSHWSDGLIHPSSSSITHVSRGWKSCRATECSASVHLHVRELWLGHLSSVGRSGISGSMLQFVARVAFDFIFNIYPIGFSGEIVWSSVFCSREIWQFSFWSFEFEEFLRSSVFWSEEIWQFSIWSCEFEVDQPHVSQWHGPDLGAILAQDLISDLIWELSRPPLAPWWFRIYRCEGWRCLLEVTLYTAAQCCHSQRVDLLLRYFHLYYHLDSRDYFSTGSDSDQSVLRSFIYFAEGGDHSLFACLMRLSIFRGSIPRIDRMGWSTHLHPQSPTSPEDEKVAERPSAVQVFTCTSENCDW